MAVQKSSPSSAERSGGGLADVIDRILDKGLVIDAWVRVSVVGLELLTIEARVVVASVDTYLRYADAISKMAQASVPPQHASQPPHAPHAPELPHREERQLPSPQDIRHYLEERGEGLSVDELAEHFGTAPEAMAEGLRRLESEGRVAQRERHS